MADPFELDFSQSNADMGDLIRLSTLSGFDLFVYLRLLSEASAPTICCEVDDSSAGTTGARIVRYKLSEGLQVILTALRARNLNVNEVSRAPSGGSAFSLATNSFQTVHNVAPIADDQR